MKDTTLVIMAAGIGSRFGGGIKQLAAVGPSGEIIMDYSIHDALEAGFTKIVFIIRRDLEKDFKEIIGNRIEKIARVEYAYQELDKLPEGFSVPEGRKKPWGTGHAILMVKDLVHEPFLVINADDYYGKEGFRKVHENTLSENGSVTRGICDVAADGILKKVEETFAIERKADGFYAENEDGVPVEIHEGQMVSMNMWGLPPVFLEELEKGFPEFLRQIPEGNLKAEYLLPKVIDKMVQEKKAVVQVLDTKDKWFGVTYQEDKAAVIESIRQLVQDGVYPEKLF